jgi:hypothetical protein
MGEGALHYLVKIKKLPCEDQRKTTHGLNYRPLKRFVVMVLLSPYFPHTLSYVLQFSS